jgi:hypothetical protein
MVPPVIGESTSAVSVPNEMLPISLFAPRSAWTSTSPAEFHPCAFSVALPISTVPPRDLTCVKPPVATPNAPPPLTCPPEPIVVALSEAIVILPTPASE